MHKFIYERPKFLSRPFWMHVICWSGFISAEIVVTALLKNRFSHPSFYLFYLINVSLFYLHGNLLARYLSGEKIKDSLVMVIITTCELIIYLLLAILFRLFLDRVLDSRMSGELKFDQAFYVSTIWRGIYFLIYASGYFFMMNYIRRQRLEMEAMLEVSRIRNHMLQMEKDFLRSQITPHLLFNTLNFIKYAAESDPVNSVEAIDRLTDILDYSLEIDKKEFVEISGELKQIENMIALNKLRYQDKLCIIYEKKITNDNFKILPILLLTLVENIFKHGNVLDASQPASILITADMTVMKFSTSNAIASALPEKSGNKGLDNIQQRLDKSYLGKYQFTYDTVGNIFRTELLIYA